MVKTVAGPEAQNWLDWFNVYEPEESYDKDKYDFSASAIAASKAAAATCLPLIHDIETAAEAPSEETAAAIRTIACAPFIARRVLHGLKRVRRNSRPCLSCHRPHRRFRHSNGASSVWRASRTATTTS
jgi:hypothetical protein